MGMVGIGKSYSVMAGDQLQIQAYAKYVTHTGSSDIAAFANALLTAFLGSTTVGVDGTPSYAINKWVASEGALVGDGSSDETDPRIFVTILLFDRNYNFLDVAYQQLASTSGWGSLTATYTVKQAGYAYMYVSNEQQVLTDVYFDDVTMTYTPSPVVQQEDFYPFGLTFNTYQRQNSLINNFQYNGKELQNDLSLNWLDYGARQYDPTIARFLSVDPAAELMRRVSPYAYSFNNPVRFTDPDGMIPSDMVENDRPCIGCAGPAGYKPEEPPQSLHDFFETGGRSDDDGKGWSGGGMRMPRVGSLGEYAGNDKQSDGGSSESNADAGGGKKGGTRIGNALRILGSLFAVSKNKTLGGKILQILSHLTWELPQQLAGIVSAEVVNAVGGIKNAYFKDGALVLESKFIGANVGYTLGNILTVGVGSSQSTISHEYGHYMQSRIFGPGYIPIFAVPSVARASVLSVGWMFGGFQNVQYDAFYTERSATRLGQKFWGDD